MSNEEILNQRWKTTDKTLKDYLKRFRSISTETLDKLVEVFDTLDITYSDLNKPISKEEKRKLDRKIKEWKKQGLLTGYFAYLISKKSKYTYSDLLEILVYGVYVEQEEKIKSTSQEVFTIVAKDVYSQALKEIPVKPKKKFSLTWEFIWSLLWIPTYNKSWDNYIQLLTMNNYQEAYKQIVQVIQQGKDLNDSMLKDLIRKQCNRILSINDDKYSGVLSDTCISLGNKVYTEPFKDEEDLKVRFIAVIDSKTTKMCRGMNNMLFYVNKTNKFFRYSDYDGRDVYYECKGLVGGINLPPILNHFHHCRSTITYDLDISYNKMYNITNPDAFVERIKRKDIENKILEYEDNIRNEDVEYMYVIQPNGNVFKFKGTKENVNFEGIDAEDSIILHNHPKDVTNYSLSNLDRNLFNENNVARLRGTDYKYTYEINRDVNFREKMPTLDDIIEDNDLHSENILYSYRYGIGYKRWKND